MTVKPTAALFIAASLCLSACSLIDASASTVDTDAAGTTETSEPTSTVADNDADNGPSSDGSLDPEAPEIPELEPPAWVDFDLTLAPIAELVEPVAFAPRSGFLHLYIGERGGLVRIIERSFTKKGAERISLSSRPALDITELLSVEGEGGLLGLAFSTDGRFMFVSYTDLAGDLVVDEYVAGRGTRADISTRRELLHIPQPFSNHNGGQLALGPDGFLYIGVGDGGSSYDPDGNGQDVTTLLGSILRIDTFASGDAVYSIPAGNPFQDGDDGRPELFLWGVRNPWRFSFDQATGDLWVADIGQDTSEEINFLPAETGGGRGANLGWGDLEGYLLTEGGSLPEGHHAPIHVYGHELGRCSVTGGFVYRGTLVPDLEGAYLFGDYCSGEIFGLHQVDGVANAWELSISSPRTQLASFGQSIDGEIYVLQRDGQLLRVELAEPEEE